MITFLKISWRNILRNPRRTIIIALIIAIGLVGMTFSWAFSNGFMKQSIDTLVNTHLSHIQIHEKGFNDNPVIKKNITESKKIYDLIKDNNNIKAITQRVKSQGMINSTETSSGVMITGIDPETEINVSNIKEFLIEGKFIEKDNKNTVYIGKKLAEDLKVGLGDKVVLMGQTINNEVGGAAFRVTGIYKSNSEEFDNSMVFTSLNSAQKLFEIKDFISEFAIIVKNPELLNETKADIVSKISVLPSPSNSKLQTTYEVLTWKEIMPGIASTIEMSNKIMYVFFLIVLISICFSIINTLFVVIFERFKELGIMKAIGTKPSQIFILVIFESFWMTVIGLIIGIVLSEIFLYYFYKVGIDLSVFSKGLGMLRLGSILHPELPFSQVIECIALTIFIVALASIYPAIVAAKIKIVEALKFV